MGDLNTGVGDGIVDSESLDMERLPTLMSEPWEIQELNVFDDIKIMSLRTVRGVTRLNR